MVDAEKEFRSDLDKRLEKEIEGKQHFLERICQQERLRYEQELQALKTAMHQELGEEKASIMEKKQEIEDILKQAQQQTSKISHIGGLEDDISSTTPTPKRLSASSLEAAARAAADAATNQRALELERKQAEMLESMQSRFQEELEGIRRGMAEGAEKERRAVEARLRETTEALEEARRIIAAREKVAEKPVEVERTRSLIMEPQQPQKKEKEDKGKEKEKEKERPKKVEEKKVETVNAAPESIKKQNSKVDLMANMKQMIKMLSETEGSGGEDSDIQQMTSNWTLADWDKLFDLLQLHIHTPLTGAPWVKSLFSHPPASIVVQKTQVDKLAEKEMVIRGIVPREYMQRCMSLARIGLDDENPTTTNTSSNGSNSNIGTKKTEPPTDPTAVWMSTPAPLAAEMAKLKSAHTAFEAEVAAKKGKDGLLKRMHQYLEEQLKMVVTSHFKNRPKPLPIVTGSGGGEGAGATNNAGGISDTGSDRSYRLSGSWGPGSFKLYGLDDSGSFAPGEIRSAMSALATEAAQIMSGTQTRKNEKYERLSIQLCRFCEHEPDNVIDQTRLNAIFFYAALSTFQSQNCIQPHTKGSPTPN
ncbi:hypothetical protein HK102_009421 [Quaeritorhiza haematococci]|nr:hypothetical protein HK102_009421 [Quaeritorhiza haematococci]